MFFLFSVVSGGITFVDSELRKDRIISLKNDLDDKHLKQILNELKNIVDLDNLLHIKSQLEQITSIHSVYIARKWPFTGNINGVDRGYLF